MKLFRNRRGVAVESALVLLLVLAFLCFSLTALVLAGQRHVDRAGEALEQRVELDRIGEAFLSRVRAGEGAEFGVDNEKYTCEATGNTLTLKKESDVVLFVEVDDSGAVTQWRYTAE